VDVREAPGFKNGLADGTAVQKEALNKQGKTNDYLYQIWQLQLQQAPTQIADF
jgi:hypothetical protein